MIAWERIGFVDADADADADADVRMGNGRRAALVMGRLLMSRRTENIVIDFW